MCSFKNLTPLSILLDKIGKPSANPENYRLIALINCISKILKKIINNKLTIYVEDKQIINPEQAGFRKQKSIYKIPLFFRSNEKFSCK